LQNLQAGKRNFQLSGLEKHLLSKLYRNYQLLIFIAEEISLSFNSMEFNFNKSLTMKVTKCNSIKKGLVIDNDEL
jgi:hypothetical protein